MELFKEKLDLDCRFEIYKQAFPEMDRDNLPTDPRDEKDKENVLIKYELPCMQFEHVHPPRVLPPPCDLDKEDQLSIFAQPDEEMNRESLESWKESWNLWNCNSCCQRSKNKIYRMLVSNFCENKDIRKELLHYYFRFVQFVWAQDPWYGDCEPTDKYISTLPRFFEAFQPSGLTEQLKHLTLHIPWKYTDYERQFQNKKACRHSCLTSLNRNRKRFDPDDSFRSDATALGRVFGVLHKYKIKAELTFPRMRECRRSFIERVEDLCKTRLRRDGPEFWTRPHAPEYDIFCLDAELRRLVNGLGYSARLYMTSTLASSFELCSWVFRA
jgi:hypothetical protein